MVGSSSMWHRWLVSDVEFEARAQSSGSVGKVSATPDGAVLKRVALRDPSDM